MKRRIISIVLCALMVLINVLNQPFGIVRAEEVEQTYDYTIMALSSDEDAFVMNVAGGNINGNVASSSTFELSNVNINGTKNENVEISFEKLMAAIDESYFTDAAVYESSDECEYNINEPICFSDSAVFENGVNLNGSIKASGDINLSGVVNINNGCIVSENGNITVETDNISLMGLIFAPNGTLTLKGNNVNLNNVCIIANKVNIDCPNYVNISSNYQLMNFVNESVTFGSTGGGEITDPTDPTEPTDPIDPTDPTDPIDPYTLFDFGDFSQFVYASADLVDGAIEIYWYTNVDSESSKIYEVNNGVQELIAEVAGDSKYTYQYPVDFSELIFVVERAGIYSYPFKLRNVDGNIQVVIDDSDGDGLNDALETIISTDIHDADSDDDSLNDYYEIMELCTNPLKKDTDGDGIEDGLDDIDGDGITNLDESTFNTNPFTCDSDGDELSDWDEIYTYHTNARLSDTDSDGADDKYEIDHGYDPIVRNASFVVEKSYGELSEGNPVSASVVVELSNGPIDSLNIEIIAPHDNPFITPYVAGIMGRGYSFEVDADFQVAELIFDYDTEVFGILSDEFQPRIYYFNEETKMFEKLENQTVENGRVKAYTTHFSTYILANALELDGAYNAVVEDGLKTSEMFHIEFTFDNYSSPSQYTEEQIMEFSNTFIQRCTTKYMSEEYSEYIIQHIVLYGDSFAPPRYSLVDYYGNNLTAEQYLCWTTLYARDVKDRYNIILVDGSHGNDEEYKCFFNSVLDYALDNDIIIYVLALSDSNKEYWTNIATLTGGNYYLFNSGNIEKIADSIPLDKYMPGYGDKNNDGIPDYYNDLIKEGRLLLTTSSNEFKGVDFNYDRNGNLSDDWDGDGIKNGDEIELVNRDGNVYVYMNSHPMRAHSDRDSLTDLEERQLGTNPFVNNLKKNDVEWLTFDYNFSYDGMADLFTSVDGVWFSKNSWRQFWIKCGLIFNEVYNPTEIYRDLLIDYYSTYISQDILDEYSFVEQKSYWTDFLYNLIPYGEDGLNKYGDIQALVDFINGYPEYDEFFVLKVRDSLMDIMGTYQLDPSVNIHLGIHGMDKMVKYLKNFQSLGTTVSIGSSVLSSGADIYDTIEKLSIVSANSELFLYHVDALQDLALYAEDSNIRAATREVEDILRGNYEDVLFEAVALDAYELDIDMIWVLASNLNYVAIVNLARNVMRHMVDGAEDMKQMYRIICYSELSNTYKRLLGGVLIENNDFYKAEDSEIGKAINYLTNLAQIRALGEQEYYFFLETDGACGLIVDSIIGWYEAWMNVNDTLDKLKVRIFSLGISDFISSKIKFYGFTY